MFERFSHAAREVVLDAKARAHGLGHRYVGTAHLLLALLQPAAEPASRILARCRAHGLIREGQGLAAQVLVGAGVDLAALRRATEDSLRQVA